MNKQRLSWKQEFLNVTPIVGQLLQRAAIKPSQVYQIPSIVHDVLRSPGQPLDAQTRAFMEPRFGHDFSGVRVHTNAKAAESAGAVQARACTVGHHMVFAPGEYSPQTVGGKSLLAHELTHVVQQANGIQAKMAISRPGDQYEQEADRTARAINHGTVFTLTEQTGIKLMRQTGMPAAAKEDKDVQELKDKVSKLVTKKFGGDYKKAFDSYDANKDGAINRGELGKLLEDAGVGNFVTRGEWVSGIIEKMDKNKDGKIQWSEFESAIKQ